MADFEFNFLPELKALHDAGYNLLAYDLRNHGESEEVDGGICGVGRHQCKDYVGIKRFVETPIPEMSKMTKELMSRCTAANAQHETSAGTLSITDIEAMVSPQPYTMYYPVKVFATAKVEGYLEPSVAFRGG